LDVQRSSLVHQLLESQAKTAPDRLVAVEGATRMTYGELEARANRLAHALIGGGVKRGDRVAIMLENGLDAVTAVFGTFKTGASIMMLHPSARGDRLRYMLDDAAPTAFVSDGDHISASGIDFQSINSVEVVVSTEGEPMEQAGLELLHWADLAAFPQTAPALSISADDLANLPYTSGSTGRPKGVMSAHANMLAAIESINGYLHNTSDDVILCTLPMSSGYGLYQVLVGVAAGARMVLESGIAFPARTVNLMEAEGVTAFPGVPTHFALLLRFPDLLAGRLPALRYLTNAGAGIPPSNVRRLRALLPHVAIYCMYGMTECTRISYLPPAQVDRRPNSVGIAIPGSEAYVVGVDGSRLQAGEIGELVVRGPHVNRGYWHATELTSERFRKDPESGETMLFTGDLFRVDEGGYLYFVARKDDIIKCGGEKVAPREVEDAVSKLDSVAEAAVTGVPDPILGEAVLLAVVAKPARTLTERMIRMHCAAVLEDHMRPKHVLLLEALPQLPSGKVDKMLLARQFAATPRAQTPAPEPLLTTAGIRMEES
jgi:amino acid adenylation domain-containing protein